MEKPPQLLPSDIWHDNPMSDLKEKSRKTAKSNETRPHVEEALREALTYTESIVDAVREPLLVLDGDLRIHTVSHAFCEMFAVSRKETIGQLLYDLDDGQWNMPALRIALEEVLLEQKSFQDFEVVHEFPNLGRRVMLLNGRKLWREGNKTDRVLLAIEDVTERKRMENEMLRSNEDLQHFAYVAAHDLRSPLNAALSLTTLLARHLAGKLDEKGSQILALSVESLQRLSLLMQDILTYAQLGNAARPQTLVSIEESLQLALTNLRHHIEKNQADIRLGPMPNLLVDRTQITLVFQNLISNAIKYRGEQAPHIRIDAVQENSQWRVSVSDNGQGFEARYALQIFEPFTRLHGSNVPGSGIGLASCKRIIERSGGRIWAESQPGIGSTFYFVVTNHQKLETIQHVGGSAT